MFMLELAELQLKVALAFVAARGCLDTIRTKLDDKISHNPVIVPPPFPDDAEW